MDLTGEHFRDPAEVLGSWAEMDYLEQFGTSSFKESALRKQSLYLKFDPLLKDSPNKLVPVATETNSTDDKHKPSSGSLPEAKLADFDFLGALDVPVTDLPPCVLGPVGLPLPADPVLNVLQYSQGELDAEVKATQMKNLELKSKYEELLVKCLEMETIMDGFEGTVTQVMDKAQKQMKLARAQIQKVLKEKDQLMTDLNSMDKSLSDLYKACEKHEEVIEGYRKNEASLKECVEDYILRIEKAGLRYQALKAHTEEKHNLAKEELAQVQRQAQVEKLAFQVSLIKEQMQIHLLQKTVEQMTTENDELISIYNDLISQVDRSGVEITDP
ncbi:transforming acidic coiled-coil-containing protein 3-like [Dugong dugon]